MARISVAFSLAAALTLGVPAAAPPAAHAFEWLGKIVEDAKGLSESDPQTRLAAVRALARYDIEWTRDDLLRMLADEDVHVRTAAGRALAAHREERALPILVKWLALPDAKSKEVGASILGDMRAQAAVPALVRALGDPEPLVRIASLVALGTIGGEAVVVPLVSLLEDDKAEVKLAAIEQLEAVGDTRAVIPLVGLFRTSSQRVRIAAITAVGGLGDNAATDALIRELGDSAAPIRLAAIGALGTLRSLKALDKLMAVLTTESTALRNKAAFSLAQIAKAHPDAPRSMDAVAALVESLAHSSLRNAATESLRATGPIAVPHLISHLDGETRGDPKLAVKLLEELGDADATPALIRELSRGRIPQATVLRALTRMGDPRALLPILGLLDDPSPDVRLGAMRSLAPLLKEPSAAADLLADRLQDPIPEIRLMAARYLGAMKARSAVPALIELASKREDFALRATSLQALGHIGDTRATSLALRSLEDPTPAIRDIAADVLTELGDPKARKPLLALSAKASHLSSALAIQALGATLRGKSDDEALGLLLKKSRSANAEISLAAIEALSGMSSKRSGETLTGFLRSADPERQRAAALAMGALGIATAKGALRTLLVQSGERVGAATALALGEIGDGGAKEHLLKACRRPGVARAVNASAALALTATAQSVKSLDGLLRHANPLVRVNVIAAIRRTASKAHVPTLEQIVVKDPSWLVRKAAIEALRVLGGGAQAIEIAGKEDPRSEVRDVALSVGATQPAATRWAVFRIVDPLRDDRAVAQDARFFVGADGIARVGHSDLRGRIYFQKFPEGDYVQGALSALAGF